MKIKRFYAQTMRKALEAVRAEQGPDAVILSKSKLPDGVEVVAATDYDEALLRQSTASQPAASQQGGTDHPVRAPAVSLGPGTGQGTGSADLSHLFPSSDTDEDAAIPQEANKVPREDSASPFELPVIPEPGAKSPAWDSIQAELEALRDSLHKRLEELEWNSEQREHPELARITERLLRMDLNPHLVRTITRLAARSKDETGMWRMALSLLARRIPLVDTDICAQGGTFCMVGPTGVGKTTNIAKLATRFALEHGPGQIGLVTTDDVRIGAQEHLFRFGRILGVPVQVAATPAELSHTLTQLAGKRLVLIDTTGCSPKDSGTFSQLQGLLDANPSVQILLNLAANVQTAALEQCVTRFEQLGLDSAIVTKLDEATALGGVVSTAIDANLPISYFTGGQQVPEDIHPACGYRVAFMTRMAQLADDAPGGTQDSPPTLHAEVGIDQLQQRIAQHA